MNATFRADVLLMTTAYEESRALIEACKNATGQEPLPVPIGERTYHNFGEINGSRVFLARCQQGSSSVGGSQQEATIAIQTLKPKYIVMVGFAFGVDEGKQQIGDILISKHLRLYDLQRVGTTTRGKKNVILRGDKPVASIRLLNWLDSARLAWGADSKQFPRIQFGTLLSGDKLVDNLNFRDELLQHEPESIGGEMEGAGLYIACHDAKKDWIVVKAICDWADRKGVDKENRQLIAASNAAEFVLYSLRHTKLTSPKRSIESLPLNVQAPPIHFSFVEDSIVVVEGDIEHGYEKENISCTYSPDVVELPKEIDLIREKISAREDEKRRAHQSSQWDGDTLALRGFGCSRTPNDEDMVLRLRFGPSKWFTHRATGLSLDDEEEVVFDGAKRKYVTLREKYLGSFQWENPTMQPNPIFTNTFAIAMCLVTNDDKLVMVRRSDEVVNENQYSISVNETLQLKKDLHEINDVNLYRVVIRGAEEELGAGVESIEEIKFLALCASIKDACWGMQGFIRLGKSFEELRFMQMNYAKDKREGKLIPVNFNAKEICKFIKNPEGQMHGFSWNSGARTCIYHTAVNVLKREVVDQEFRKSRIFIT